MTAPTAGLRLTGAEREAAAVLADHAQCYREHRAEDILTFSCGLRVPLNSPSPEAAHLARALLTAHATGQVEVIEAAHDDAIEFLRRFPATEQQQPGIDAALAWLSIHTTSPAPAPDAGLREAVEALAEKARHLVREHMEPGGNPSRAGAWAAVVTALDDALLAEHPTTPTPEEA